MRLPRHDKDRCSVGKAYDLEVIWSNHSGEPPLHPFLGTSWLDPSPWLWCSGEVSRQALLGEFQRHAQLYCAFSFSLGLLFGAMDGPLQQPIKEEKVETVSMEDWRKRIPAAPRPGE